MTLYNLFPVQLGHYHCDLSANETNFLNGLIDVPQDYSVCDVKKISHGRNVLDDSSLLQLRTFIIESSCDFLVNTFGLSNALHIANSWINIAHPSSSQHFHSHANSLISGTYYISFDSSIHPSLVLKHPRPHSSFSAYEDIPFLPTIYNSPLFQLSYSQGDLLLWPSYLEHGFFGKMNTSISSVPRVSLSFNININHTLLHPYSLSLA